MQYKKKIENNKSNIFIVPIKSDEDYNYTTDVDSSDVIKALNSNMLVVYKITDNNKQICNNISGNNKIVTIDEFMVGTTLVHNGTNITLEGGG